MLRTARTSSPKLSPPGRLQTLSWCHIGLGDSGVTPTIAFPRQGPGPIPPNDWVGWRLWKRLVALPKVGPTRASKLLERKRPRLRPIYDSVVAEVIGTRRLWEPLRAELQDNTGLHSRLVRLGEQAQLPSEVSAIRVFDVVAWMEGTYAHGCPWPSVDKPTLI